VRAFNPPQDTVPTDETPPFTVKLVATVSAPLVFTGPFSKTAPDPVENVDDPVWVKLPAETPPKTVVPLDTINPLFRFVVPEVPVTDKEPKEAELIFTIWLHYYCR
jgi:hypothetical protein